MVRSIFDETRKVSVDVLPVPPLSDFTVTLLTLSPEVLGVVSMLKVHMAPGARDPSMRDTKPDVPLTVPPPQLEKLTGGATTDRLAGKISMKLIPVRVMPTFSGGFVILKFRTETPPGATGFGEKVFKITGGEITVRDANPGPPLLPSTEVISPVELSRTPPTVEATTTVILQETPAASVPPDRPTEPSPGAPPVRLPPQPLFTAAVTTVMPGGKTSLKARPVRVAFRLGFPMLILRVEVPSLAMVFRENDLLIVGATTTNRVALAGLLSPPLSEIAVVVFTFGLGVMLFAITGTRKVQVLPAVNVGMVTERDVDPGAGAKVPVQEIEGTGAGATTIPLGSKSVSVTPPNVTLVRNPVKASVFGLPITICAMAVPFKGIVGISRFVTVDRKDLEIVGGNRTDMLAVAAPPGPPSFEPTLLVVFCLKP